MRPEIATIELPDTCNTETIFITFSEQIECSSLNNSSVTITGPEGSYFIEVFSENCNAGALYDDTYILTLNPPVADFGDYTISFNDEPTDLCGNKLIPASFDFTIIDNKVGPTVELDTSYCKGDSYLIDAYSGIAETYLWEDGSQLPTLEVFQPGNYMLTIVYDCYKKIEVYEISEQDSPDIDNYDTLEDKCEQGIGELFNIESSGVAPFMYSLDGINYSSDPNFDALFAQSYTLYLKDKNNCVDSTIIEISNSNVNIDIELKQIESIKFKESVILEATIIGNSPYFYWSTDSTTLSCINCLTPEATPLSTTTYTFHAFDEFGCEVIKSVTIRVIIPYTIYAPNIFSPNSDGINDVFTIFGGEQVKTIQNLTVYSRWGEKVFEGIDFLPGDTNSGWTGTFKDSNVNSGVFAWIATVEYIDGYIKTFSGDILAAP